MTIRFWPSPLERSLAASSIECTRARPPWNLRLTRAEDHCDGSIGPLAMRDVESAQPESLVTSERPPIVLSPKSNFCPLAAGERTKESMAVRMATIRGVPSGSVSHIPIEASSTISMRSVPWQSAAESSQQNPSADMCSLLTPQSLAQKKPPTFRWAVSRVELTVKLRFFERCQQVEHRLLPVGEEHQGVVGGKEGIGDARKPGTQAAFDHHHRPRLVDVDDRHAGDRA